MDLKKKIYLFGDLIIEAKVKWKELMVEWVKQ